MQFYKPDLSGRILASLVFARQWLLSLLKCQKIMKYGVGVYDFGTDDTGKRAWKR